MSSLTVLSYSVHMKERVVMLRKMLSIDVKSDNSVYGGPGMKELKIVLESPSVTRHLLD